MSNPPEYYQSMKAKYPELFDAYETLGTAAKKAGPLDSKSAALVKLALSVGAGMEGATHANTRKALSAGCKPDEIRQVAILAVTTLGFPNMMRANAWVEDVLSQAH